MSDFRVEFSDFPEADMPPIPATFEDASWHNDSCPCLLSERLALCIWVDYADPAMSEIADFLDDKSQHQRFGVVRMRREADGFLTQDDSAWLCHTNDWQEVLAHLLADVHAATLREWLTAEQWADMLARNAADPEVAAGNCCHSHDFCDANMAMAGAFQTVLGRDIFQPCDVGAEGCTEALVDADCDLANRAWAIAAERHLKA